jgi:hypothetical protein
MLYFTTNMTQPQLEMILNTSQFAYETPNVVSPGILQVQSEEQTKDLEDYPEMVCHRRIMSIEKLKELYLETLTPKEHKSYIIARDHLGMSFTLEKSVGFLQWKSTFMPHST